MRMKRHARSGFTLVEMMVVVAMIGILATIAMPKLAYAYQKAREGSAKGNLGALRGALSVYHADTEGQWPADLATLALNAKYITAVPAARGVSPHPDSSAALLAAAPDDAGGWVYNGIPGDAGQGQVRINCTHADTAGRVWSDQ
jgi:general secretion pathway protein G